MNAQNHGLVPLSLAEGTVRNRSSDFSGFLILRWLLFSAPQGFGRSDYEWFMSQIKGCSGCQVMFITFGASVSDSVQAELAQVLGFLELPCSFSSYCFPGGFIPDLFDIPNNPHN